MNSTLALAKQLLAEASITPDDKNCQQILAERLRAIGFQIEEMHFSNTKNFYARLGSTAPLLCFAGHTGNGRSTRSPPPNTTANCTRAAQPT